MQDLATQLGVSPSTVSRALRGDPQIAALTQGRVRQLAHDLGYRPNVAAQALFHRRSGTVGLLLPRSSHFVFANPYFDELLRGLSEVAEREDHPLLLSTALRPDYGCWLHEERVDGLITLGSSVSESCVPTLKQLVEEGYPLVLIHAPPGEIGTVTVSSDERSGIHQALAHLAGLGHRRVVFVAGPKESAYARERERAYWDGLETFGLARDEALRVYGADTEASGYAQLDGLLARKVPFTAVLADNDLSAVGACRALKVRSYRIPEDVSVVGFDDIPLSAWLEPPLTTVHQPVRELGRRAMQTLLALLNGERAESLRLPTHLVVRGSSGPVKGALQ
jgi:DNA-binding LacI/PurR family transcriptional regulator